MKIGIDARILSEKNIAGVGVYLINILKWIVNDEKYNKNEYYLYSHKNINIDDSIKKHFICRKVEAKNGTYAIRYKLPSYIKKDGIDIFWGPAHLLPKKVKGIKYIVTIHDLALLINPKWGERYNALIQNLFIRKCIRESDKIIAISKCTKQDIMKYSDNKQLNIKTIYNGGPYLVEDDVKKEIIDKFKLEDKYFLYVGTIEPRKNIETIIKAFEQFCESEKDYKLVLAGKLGWKYNYILKKINSSKVKEKIILTGYISDEEKKALFLYSTAFLYASHYEGFGIPVLEAMSMRTVVISSNNSALLEVLGEAGLQVDNENDYILFSDMMKQVVSFTPNERNMQIEKEIKQIDKFSWTKCAKETLDYICDDFK